MNKPYADLHVHSYYSDGSMSPEELVEAAIENGVGILAIADHNTIEGSIQARELCRTNEIHYIPAVEIDTLDNGELQHIIAYGFDISNSAFIDFINHSHFMLHEMSIKLIERMQSDYTNLSLSDFFDYRYDRRLGGWEGAHYLIEKGIISSLKDGIPFYPKYDVTHSNAGFSSVTATAYRIKMAGGYSVLAHPGEMFDTSDIDLFKDELRRIALYGVDGIECYYPTNSEEVTEACLEVCNEHDLLITAGSDCHGTFGRTRVGEMNIPISKLRLKKLLETVY